MQSIKYIWLDSADNLPDISRHSPFKALLSVDQTLHQPERQNIADWLVTMGAMHITVRGEDCAGWKDSLRQANLSNIGLDEMQPEQFVMITTHPHENLRSVFGQLSKHAQHTHIDLSFTVIIHIAAQSGEVEYRSIFSRL